MGKGVYTIECVLPEIRFCESKIRTLLWEISTLL